MAGDLLGDDRPEDGLQENLLLREVELHTE